MSLEAIAVDEGRSLAERIRLNGRTVNFVRGELNIGDESIRMIVESSVLGFKRRYAVYTDTEAFSEPGLINVFGQYYIGDLLFGSTQVEDRFYELVKDDFDKDLIGPERYNEIRQEIDSRLKLLYAKIYDGNLPDRRLMLAMDLSAAALVGIAKMIKSRSSEVLRSLMYAVAAFSATHIAQKYVKTKKS